MENNTNNNDTYDIMEGNPEKVDNNSNISNNSDVTKGWSWAGSFATLVTFVASANWGLVVAYIVCMFIPFLNFLAMLGFLIYGGLKGKEIIFNSNRFTSNEQKLGALKALESVGFFFFIMMCIFFGIFILFMILGIGFFSMMNF